MNLEEYFGFWKKRKEDWVYNNLAVAYVKDLGVDLWSKYMLKSQNFHWNSYFMAVILFSKKYTVHTHSHISIKGNIDTFNWKIKEKKYSFYFMSPLFKFIYKID